MASRPKYCIQCGDKRTERPDGICQPCTRAANPPERRWRPCEICGETTTSKRGTHPACRLAEPSGEDAGLTDGDWRFDPFRRIQVWVPRPVPPPDPNAPLCKGCEKPFKKGHAAQVYCTERCRKRAGWARRSVRYNQRRNQQREQARQDQVA